MPKRKASPEKATQVKRPRVAELPDPTMNSKEESPMVTRLKRKALNAGEGPSSPTKKIRLLDHVQGDEEPASSSLDTTKDCKTRRPKRKRVAELPAPSMKPREDARMVTRLMQKALDGGEGPSNPVKNRRLDLVQGDEEPASTSAERSAENVKACSDKKETACTRNGKRKAAGDGTVSPTNKKTSLNQETKRNTKKSVAEQKRDFEAKYVQQDQLGAGGCGTVFAGYRKIDNFPVAIKHIKKDKVLCKVMDEDGKQLSVEVAAMLKLAAGPAGSVGTSATVSLLEWFNLRTELILVMERPIPAMDLKDYIQANEGSLTEETAKVILKQLIEAAKELEDKKIFHRDIKTANILIETGSDVPRVRLIDFGLSCFFKNRSRYRTFFGTLNYCPPEWLTSNYYRSGPTTVWQMGAVLYEVVHAGAGFNTLLVLGDILNISTELSTDCQNFLEQCLNTDPEKRPTLEDLLVHPWLN